MATLSTDAAEKELDALGDEIDRVDRPTPTRLSFVALLFAHRARSIYAGVRHAAAGPSAAVAWGTPRPLLECWILLRWIELDPDLHMEMWVAEQERHSRKMLSLGLMKSPALAARMLPTIPAGRFNETDKHVADARAKASAAGEPIGKSGSLLPSLEIMVARVGSNELTEGYYIAYALMSSFTHVAAGSFNPSTTFGPQNEIRVDEGSLRDTGPLRALSATIYAGLLEDVSRIAGLGIEARARAVLDGLRG